MNANLTNFMSRSQRDQLTINATCAAIDRISLLFHNSFLASIVMKGVQTWQSITYSRNQQISSSWESTRNGRRNAALEGVSIGGIN